MKKTILIFTAILLLCFFSSRNADRFIPEFTVSQHTVTHQITGFVQTPRGGQAGTTDLKRPTLSELGMRQVSIPESRWILRWNRFGIYLDIQPFSIVTHPTLKSPLITYAEKLASHTALTVKLKANLYHAGIFYRETFFGVTLLDFSYGFQHGAINRERHYHHLVPSVGWKWDPMILYSLPIGNGLTIYRRVTENFLRYRDTQPTPNWVEING